MRVVFKHVAYITRSAVNSIGVFYYCMYVFRLIHSRYAYSGYP